MTPAHARLRALLATRRRATRYAKVGVLGALLALASCGCAGSMPAKPIADARRLVDATDPPIAEMDAGLLAIEPVLIAACTGSAPLLDSTKCGPALHGYDTAAVALRKTQEALVAVDAGLAVLEAIAGAQ
jgi:hypothetical protein